MFYRYKNLYIMHYGVGHDKGGHSGRYPWGSGENPYGGVNPKTKKSDLFKLNGRRFNDVASDLIVKKKYGNRTDVTEEQIAQSKARTQAFLRGVEATILTVAASAVGQTTLGALQAASNMEELRKNSEDFTKQYVNAQTGLLELHNSQSDRSSFAARSIRDKMSYNKTVGNTPLWARNGRQANIGLWKAEDMQNYLPKENNTSNNSTFDFSNVTTWDTADIKTFENSVTKDFEDFQKEYEATKKKIDAARF